MSEKIWSDEAWDDYIYWQPVADTTVTNKDFPLRHKRLSGIFYTTPASSPGHPTTFIRPHTSTFANAVNHLWGLTLLSVLIRFCHFLFQHPLQSDKRRNKTITNQKNHLINFFCIIYVNGQILFFQHK